MSLFLHSGLLDDPEKFSDIAKANLALVQVQGIIVGFLASLVPIIMAQISGSKE